MKPNLQRLAALGVTALALTLVTPSVHAATPGFVELSSVGTKVLTRCNPRHLAYQQRCRVNSLPGASGFALVASRSSDIVKNDVVIGTLHDRVWKHADGTHIFGAQIRLNANAYDLTGLSFNANDFFRQVLEDKRVSVAYFQGTSTKALKRAGRTLQGLHEVPPEEEEEEATGVAALDAAADATNEPIDFVGPSQPVRDNDWVDFRIDANAAETTGRSSPHSPWLLVRTRAPAGFSVQPFAIRLLSSDFADSSEFVEIYLAGYQPN
jgi:hypothetical protein